MRLAQAGQTGERARLAHCSRGKLETQKPRQTHQRIQRAGRGQRADRVPAAHAQAREIDERAHREWDGKKRARFLAAHAESPKIQVQVAQSRKAREHLPVRGRRPVNVAFGNAQPREPSQVAERPRQFAQASVGDVHAGERRREAAALVDPLQPRA